MKNVILISIIGAFLFFAPNQSFAQTQGQEKREEAKEKRDKAQDKREEAKDSREKQDKLSKDNQGHAYGKDKGNMSGREFGQHRAEMARNKANYARTRLQETENVLIFQKERLRTLERTVEEDARKPNADRNLIEERKMRIRQAEERLSKLEVALNESKERLRRAERSLEAVIENN
jgi:colicin import membrane protein